MNEKLSFQHVSDALAQKMGVSKKVADVFTKAFFDTVVDAFYMGEEVVKVKGLGTFKLVVVESRESVNVSNGERIVIPGYKKVSFVPEDSVVEFLNPEVEVPVEEEESFVEETPVVEDEPVEDEVEVLIQVAEPVHVEEPQDAFSGIDMLISTPESMDEVRQQYEEAKAKMETAVEEARKANAEKMRLEKLLARLEANVVPETAEEVEEESVMTAVQEDAVEETSVVEASAQEDKSEEPDAAEEDKHQEALSRFMNEGSRAEVKPQKSHTTAWVLTIVFVLLAAICFFLYQTFLSIEAVETVPKTEKKEQVKKMRKPAKPKKSETSKQVESEPAENKQNAPEATDKKEEAKPSNPAKPATHVLQRGESLTRISQKFYGTKDSVPAIIRANKFENPNNLPVGTVVKLP